MNSTYCGKISEINLNKQVTINGWLRKNRKLGSLIFLDVGDRFGIVQVIVPANHPQFEVVQKIARESVIKVIGKVQLRISPNLQIPTGKYEIILESIEILSKAEITPFVIDEECMANEDTRLKYRYLDLRRAVIKNNIIFRSKVVQSIRNFLIEQDFIEVDTPILCRPTPEGAKDYLVPTRNQIGAFYALPQSPQTFKQLLMVAGFDRYFQIAKCFRDEPLRSDRQPEFTQVDMEFSFVDETFIQTTVESLFKQLFKDVMNINLVTPFQRMTYANAMEKYGCDKPDLRFDCIIQNANHVFKDTKFEPFKKIIEDGRAIKYIFIQDHLTTKKEINTLEKFAKDNGAKRLAWITFKDSKLNEGSIADVIESEIIDLIRKENNITNGSIILVADDNDIASKALGAVRNEAAKLFNLVNANEYHFLWVIDWPLYEHDKNSNQFTAAHHPFTSPTIECMDDFDKNQHTAMARSYDIVLNGYEIGGGSIRITDPKIQNRMFRSLGMDDAEINDKFGFLINAFKYGVPPHAGIALGLDRILMLMCKTNNIKDVICFPKNSSGNDLMMESPSKLNDLELNELNLKLIK